MNPTREDLENALMTLMDAQDTIYTLMMPATGNTQEVLTRAVSAIEDATADIQDLIDALAADDADDENA